MNIKSPAFRNGKKIPSKYSCEGKNINPPLEISDVPDEAKSLALIVEDPDAPNKCWVHWTLWNISPDTELIEEDSIPENAIEGTTDFDKPGYGGPCPPSGTHRYFFRLYALTEKLSLKGGSSANVLKESLVDSIESTSIIGIYSKR